jgi:hypothetical protein
MPQAGHFDFIVISIFDVVWKLLWLGVFIVLIVKFWRACATIQELNRTVQFMAYDIKDLRERIGARPANQTPGIPPQTENPTEQDQ